MPNLSCRICQGQFYVRPYRSNTAKFCSRRCLGKAKLNEITRLAAIRGKPAPNSAGLSVPCKTCGRTFSIPPSRIGSKKFCSQFCYATAQKTPLPRHRYVRISVNGKRVLEHRHVMEMALGRTLEPWEQVDHINRDRHDNRPENLRVLSIWEHGSLSASQRGT